MSPQQIIENIKSSHNGRFVKPANNSILMQVILALWRFSDMLVADIYFS